MLENVTPFWKKTGKKEPADKSKDAAKERLHLVLMQDRANVSADFLDMMKQEIVDVIKKYIDVNETDMDVKLENRTNNDGTTGAPALFANIPIVGINEEKKKESEEITKSKKEEAKIDVTENKETIAKTKKTRTTKTSKTAKALATKKAEAKEAKAKKKVSDDGTDNEKGSTEKVKKTVTTKKSTVKAKTSTTKKTEKKEDKKEE